ncbi:hypothetical protein KSP40_PGU007861 [Platanthera guangdongensis]|uniref:Uncharacterized protein n=1 Tax=Platanthera guangdongensis TaxID=2320717 RepID=A0ABR2MQ25_9ASPA
MAGTAVGINEKIPASNLSEAIASLRRAITSSPTPVLLPRWEMNAGGAAKLIVEALLQRFLPLARRRIETAQAQR